MNVRQARKHRTVSSAQSGFTLVELAIVILVMGLILGGLAMPLATQRENARLRDSRAQLDSVLAAIEGFALVNG
ncbi:MAG: type II secretion system protein, partial [Woeseiaceae bacterium]